MTNSPSTSDPNEVAVILIVDDQRSVTGLLQALLSLEGHRALVASGGVEAGVLISEHRPELVISDLKMPDVSGVDLVKQHHALLPETKWILMSGRIEPGSIEGTEGLPIAAILRKPFGNKEFVETVTAVLAENTSR